MDKKVISLVTGNSNDTPTKGIEDHLEWVRECATKANSVFSVIVNKDGTYRYGSSGSDNPLQLIGAISMCFSEYKLTVSGLIGDE
jgi:hypothetical protein